MLFTNCSADTQRSAYPESVADAYHVQERHCTYYIDFLHRRLHDMNGGRQRGATAEIKAELNNIRAAWAHAVEQGRISDIQPRGPNALSLLSVSEPISRRRRDLGGDAAPPGH